MTLLALAAAALPIAAVYLLLQPAREAGVSQPCRVALAVGLGLGVASCTFFLALLLFDGHRLGVIALDGMLFAAAIVVWRRSNSATATALSTPLAASERVLALAVFLAATAAAISFLANTLEIPHGHWDAWATWNLRARWLATAWEYWREAFPKPTIHGDYPLLLPATIARLWVYTGDWAITVPALVGAAYAAALVLLLYAGVAALRGPAQGFVGALCLLGTPLYLRVAPWQYADVPLAFNLLAAITLLALYERDPAQRRRLLLWAGLAIGLTAWTKNEGMMLAAVVLAVRGALSLRRGRPDLRGAAWFAAGLLPPGILLLYFRLTMAPRSPQFQPRKAPMRDLLADPARYETILSIAASELWRGTFPVLIGLALYALLLGRTGDAGARRMAVRGAAILAVATLAYGFNYVVSRAELTWLVSHSVARLELQIWPAALFALLLYVASPTERIAAVAVPASAPRQPRAEPRRRARR